jgi:hypothetical protein
MLGLGWLLGDKKEPPPPPPDTNPQTTEQNNVESKVTTNNSVEDIKNQNNMFSNNKPGKTPPKSWPVPPGEVVGKKPKWNPEGYWEGPKGRKVTWDDRSHGAGVDRGEGPQGGHWDNEGTDERWDEEGNSLAIGNKNNTGKVVAAGVGAAAGGYILYRAIRMAPSLFPPLWPTIPVNAAVP